MSDPGKGKPQACVIGLDLGTSGVRSAVMGREQNILPGGEKCAFTDLKGDPGDPDVWWQAVTRTLQATVIAVREAGHEVIALSIDGTSGTVLPVDMSGVPLASPMMYNDSVSDQAVLESIAAFMPATSAAGGATSGLAKALVFSALKPARILHQADWIAGRLMEDFRFTDSNNALKTGYDAVDGQWPDWIDATGFKRSLLPDVLLPGASMGRISQSAAARFGLDSTVHIIAGTTDGCASFLATGASEPGDAVTALGSTITLKVLSNKPVYAPEFGVYSHLIGDQWLAGGASNSGGRVLAHFFSDDQLRALTDAIDMSKPSTLDYYPLVTAGERFPINDSTLLPRLTPRPDEDAQFLYGMLEGMAAIESAGYRRLMENGAPALRSMRTVGGGASNPCWTSLREKRLGVPFLKPLSVDAAAGTARLAVTGATTMNLW